MGNILSEFRSQTIGDFDQIKSWRSGGIDRQITSDQNKSSHRCMGANLSRGSEDSERLSGDWETGGRGDWETGRLGDWAIGRLGDWGTGGLGDACVDLHHSPSTFTIELN